MKRGHDFPGLWISFEAGEGAGKGTQQEMLFYYLQGIGYVVERGREPGTTPAGEEFRKFLQDPSRPELNPKTETLFYVGAGVEFFEGEVRPALKKGKTHITDRWRDSTRAYQGYGLGIDLNVIDILTKFSCSGAVPDITYLIDIDAKTGLAKAAGHEFEGAEKDKIEARDLGYHKKVNQGYRELAARDPDRFKIIPYIEGNPEEMHNQIRKHVNEFIEKYGLESTLARS